MNKPFKVFYFAINRRKMKLRTKVILVCEECLSRNYTTSKNPQKTPQRIEMKKYCKNCDKYTIHKETK